MARSRSGRQEVGLVCGPWMDMVSRMPIDLLQTFPIQNNTRVLLVVDGAANVVVSCRGRLASAGDDGTIKLWGSTSWACEVTVHNLHIQAINPGNNYGVVAMHRFDLEVALPLCRSCSCICRYSLLLFRLYVGAECGGERADTRAPRRWWWWWWWRRKGEREKQTR